MKKFTVTVSKRSVDSKRAALACACTCPCLMNETVTPSTPRKGSTKALSPLSGS